MAARKSIILDAADRLEVIQAPPRVFDRVRILRGAFAGLTGCVFSDPHGSLVDVTFDDASEMRYPWESNGVLTTLTFDARDLEVIERA